jgi:hypothetical protein
VDGAENFDGEFEGVELGVGVPPSGVFEGGDNGFDAFRAFGMAVESVFFVTSRVEVGERVHEGSNQ